MLKISRWIWNTQKNYMGSYVIDKWLLFLDINKSNPNWWPICVCFFSLCLRLPTAPAILNSLPAADITNQPAFVAHLISTADLGGPPPLKPLLPPRAWQIFGNFACSYLALPSVLLLPSLRTLCFRFWLAFPFYSVIRKFWSNFVCSIFVLLFFAGAYGTVFRARDTKTGKIVAIKKVRIALNENGVPMSTLREIALLKQLNASDHANIVKWVCTIISRILPYLSWNYYIY